MVDPQSTNRFVTSFLRSSARARLHTGGNFFREKALQEVGHGFVPFGAAVSFGAVICVRKQRKVQKGAVIRVGVTSQGVPGRLSPHGAVIGICRQVRSARAEHSRARPR